MKLLVVFAVLLVGASAHLCLLDPKQRGTVSDLNTAGATDCLLTDSPCGKRDSETAVKMKTGNVTIIFQKNLDHFTSKSPGPGMFTINLWKGTDMKTLKTIPDTAPPNGGKQWLYTETVAIPSDTNGDRILQVQYVTKNSEAPAVFYQCADVTF